MNSDLFRVALIGPESSGKTMLCSQLAEHFNTKWVPEFAREYIQSINRPYTKEDIIFCAEQQIESEERIKLKANKIIFSDTELIVCRVWLIDVFGDCPDWIEKKIMENKYDLYLLTRPDIPFEEDPVRENPQRRQYFFDWYRVELKKRKFHFEIVDGLKEERFQNTLDKINWNYSDFQKK